jgi:hypothetical protein
LIVRRAVPALVAVALAVGFGGCSKRAQLEEQIAKQFAKDVSISDVKVTCPEGVKAKADEEVECIAEGDFTALGVTGGRLTLFVTFPADNRFVVTDFSAGGEQITIRTSPASSSS